MYRIITFTPVWRRPEVFEICLAGLKRLQKYKPEKFQITPFFIVSEKEQAEQVERYGFDFIMYKNDPLGEKKNAGLRHVMKNYDFDYILELGSDDLIRNDYLDFIEPELEAGTPQFNLSSTYFVDTRDGKTAYWESDIIIGLGRFISRAAIEETLSVQFQFSESCAGPDVSYAAKQIYTIPIKSARHYEKCSCGLIISQSDYHLWKDDANRAMDTHSLRRLQRAGVPNKIIQTKEVWTVDLKCDANLNHIERLETTEKGFKDILNYFPERDFVVGLVLSRLDEMKAKIKEVEERCRLDS